MRLEIHADYLALGREQIHVGTEHLNRSKSTVQKDERFAFACDLVTELDPVDTGALRGFGFQFRTPLYFWCAWQESNLLPFGPEPNALSGELQAR